MALNLKIRMVGTGRTTTVRFAENMSVHDAIKNILEKERSKDAAADKGPGKDHAFFKPLHEDSGPRGGKWLRPEKTLEFYDLRTNDLLEFRKKHEIVAFRLVDNSTKKVLTDMSAPISEIVDNVAKKIGLKNPEEFSLQLALSSGSHSDWLKKDESLLSQMETGQEEVLLKKKYFVSDANVDRDDPVQLHLVYIQSRDDIVAGKHPTAKEEAVQLAALQSQIDMGDLNPQNPSVAVKSVLAPMWHKDKAIDKAIITEWKKLAGMTEINAKFRYVQFCRSLKTYGITVFTVQMKSAKGKLAKKFLGFTRDSIMLLSEEAKEIEKTWPLSHLRRWAASNDTFTLDFGSHEDDYITVVTQEGDEISSLIGGYIDILLKKNKDANVVIDDDDAEVGTVSEIARVGGTGVVGQTANSIAGHATFSQNVVDIDSAARAVNRMIEHLFGEVTAVEGNANLSAEQRKQQIADHSRNLEGLAAKLIGIMNDPNGIDKNALNATSKQITQGLETLVVAARNAAALGLDPDGTLFEGVKSLAECLQNLLNSASEAQKNPNDMDAKNKLANATAAVQAALVKLNAVGRGVKSDEAYQKLLIELGKSVKAATMDLIGVAERAKLSDASKQSQVDSAKGQVGTAADHLVSMTTLLAPTAQDAACKNTLDKTGKSLQMSAQFLNATIKSGGISPTDTSNLTTAMTKLNEALANLLNATELQELEGGTTALEFSASAQTILESCGSLMASKGKAEVIQSNTKLIDSAAQHLEAATYGIAAKSDPQTAQRLKEYATGVSEATRMLLATAPPAIKDPNNEAWHSALRGATQRVADATEQLVADAGEQIALSALYSAAKLAAASSTALISCSITAQPKLNDAPTQQALAAATQSTSEAVNQFISEMKTAISKNADPSEALMASSEKFAPAAYKLVAAAKQAIPKTTDPTTKRELAYNADNAAKAIHKFLVNRKAARNRLGQQEITAAMEQFNAAEAELDAALLSLQTDSLEPTTQTREQALRAINNAVKSVANATKGTATAAKETPEELGANLVKLSQAHQEVVTSAKVLAATIDDKQLQRAILQTVHGLGSETRELITSAKAVAKNPKDENLNKLLADSGRNVAGALAKLVNASKGVVPKDLENFQKKAGDDIEDLAEKELAGCAAVITASVARLKAAQEEARKRRETPDIDIDAANITEAILDACAAIGQSTSILIGASTKVQHEFNQLMKAPQTRAVYKRDPAWAKGLISASKEVAATVQHLVGVADKAAKGEAVEEALVVSANQVSAATTRLVTASSVKKGVSDASQNGLKEASKQVGAATRALVEAAKQAAQFKDEMESREKEKYVLANSKIQEMEEQMEILRLERELEKKRQAMLNKRKKEYEDATGTEKPAPPAETTKSPPPARPTSAEGKPATMVGRGGTPRQMPAAPGGAGRGRGRGGPARPLPPPESQGLSGKMVWRNSAASNQALPDQEE